MAERIRIVEYCSLFADDCLLYREIDIPDDCKTLQNDLSKVARVLGK